jgi:hypothetical protein
MLMIQRPNFFIVGAPKTGTTAMNAYLSRHPLIFMAQKELQYFSDECFYDPPLDCRDLDWYLSFFKAAGDKPLRGEASVWYLSSKIAAARIMEFNPNAKIVIHVRNPIDLIISYHSELLFLGYEDIQDIEQALDAEAERRRGLRMPRGCRVPRVLFYSEIGRISEQVDRFVARFGRQNVHINQFEKFAEDPAAVYHETLIFLGAAEPTFKTMFDSINGNKAIRYRTLQTFMDRPPKHLRQAVELIPTPIRRTIRSWMWRINTRFVPRPTPKPAVIARLSREFGEEIERFKDLLERLNASSGPTIWSIAFSVLLLHHGRHLPWFR